MSQKVGDSAGTKASIDIVLTAAHVTPHLTAAEKCLI